jgi:excisionase family DNA binding protein
MNEALTNRRDQTVTESDRNFGVLASSRRLLTLPQAVAYIGLSAWKLRQLIHDGKLPIVDLNEGQKFWIDRRDLDALVERNKRVF